MKIKELIKSYSFWTALAGALVVFIGVLGDVFGFSVKDSIINDVVMGIAGILVVFGVVTMPVKKQEAENKTETTEEIKDESVEENKKESD